MLNQRSDKLELIRIAEAVALEKAIDKDLILSSMESGIEKAAKSRFGFENNIKVTIDRSTGNIDIYRVLKIVENPTNRNTEISLVEAKKISKEENEDKKIGDEILETLPTFDFGRIAAQTAKQVITQNVREAERERQYNDFKDKKEILEEGAQIVEEVKNKPPMDMLGHVTSSYYSPNLNKSIALAIIKNGKKLKGKKLFVPMPDKTIKVTVSDTVFLDKEGNKLNAWFFYTG